MAHYGNILYIVAKINITFLLIINLLIKQYISDIYYKLIYTANLMSMDFLY